MTDLIADAELLALCAEALRMEEREMTMEEGDSYNRAISERYEVLHVIASTPAKTSEGVRAKAAAVHRMMNQPVLLADLQMPDKLVWSLVNDLVRTEPASSDAELIRLCDRLVVVNADFNACETITADGETDPIAVELGEIMERLFKLPSPRTREGAQAAAKAMLSGLPSDCLQEAVDNSNLETWLGIARAEYLVGPPA
jgi:hypothetical protein